MGRNNEKLHFLLSASIAKKAYKKTLIGILLMFLTHIHTSAKRYMVIVTVLRHHGRLDIIVDAV